MKIKSDFITNSSSTSYIMWWPGNDMDGLTHMISEIAKDPEGSNEGVNFDVFETIEELDYYTNGEIPLDWVQKARGFPNFEYMDEGNYKRLKKAIQNGNFAIDANIDWNIELEKYIPEEYIIECTS